MLVMCACVHCHASNVLSHMLPLALVDMHSTASDLCTAHMHSTALGCECCVGIAQQYRTHYVVFAVCFGLAIP